MNEPDRKPFSVDAIIHEYRGPATGFQPRGALRELGLFTTFEAAQQFVDRIAGIPPKFRLPCGEPSYLESEKALERF